jgi:N-glycosylase/DNA lyase
MARTSWFDDKAGTEQIQDRVRKLETFTNALADGVITSQELGAQEKRLIDVMKAAESALNDDQHGKVTTLLVELTAYNIMRLLHELQAERAKMAVR